MSISVGQTAPAFNLPDTAKQLHNLEQYKGKNVLLLFFPFAFTGTCTKELCGVRDDIARYANANAEVLGISIDTHFTLKKYKEEQNLPFALLSDFNKEAINAYGVAYDEFILMKGVAKRAAFLIDKDGIVRYAEVLENASEIPDFGAINNVLEGLD
ncbi:MAG: redoxin domain-containing protein [Bacteroidota bacterium]|nr:redoxin domain-containing protein [Bacteroidota bacterium]